MIAHPAHALTPVQRSAFELLCVGHNPGCTRKTYHALVASGLVDVFWTTRRDALGSYDVPTYSVPLWARMQWCDWCAEQPIGIAETMR
jgi:hypothetical protein